MQFNITKFLENTQKIHLKSDEVPIYAAIQDTEVRAKLDDFIDYGKNPRFSKALDEICANIVGRTMFRVLMTKLHIQKNNVRLVPHDDKGSKYKEYIVYVNLSFYKENGEGIPSRYYYYIDKKGKIKMKLKSLAGSIFHEFCHGLHHISKTKKSQNILCLDGSDIQEAWTKDEELRTIACFGHDPICDHCFDFCQSIMKNETFLPRYSHGGYEGESEPTARKLQKYYKAIPISQKYMDGWKEYVL
jgi:hypothetical protein